MTTNKRTFTLLLTAIIFACAWASCNQKNVSPIEKIVVDEEFINSKIAGSNFGQTFSNEDKSTRTIYYFKKDSSTIIVHRDDLGRIRAWFQDRKGKRVDGAEVYPATGQICGKLNYVNGVEVGEIKFYYEDGRVESKGVFKNDKRWGEWKNYDKEGKLVSITNYADDGARTTTEIKK